MTFLWQIHWNVALWSLGGLQCSLSLKQKAFNRLCYFLRGRAGPGSGLVLLACILMNLACVGSRGCKTVVQPAPHRLAMSAATMPWYFVALP